METALLVMLIVVLIAISAISFFVFQIWVHSKEMKLYMANVFSDMQKGFANSDEKIKTSNENLMIGLSNEIKVLTTVVDEMNDKHRDLIDQQLVSIKMLKDHLSEELNLVKAQLSGKLIQDLLNITDKISEGMKNQQLEIKRQQDKVLNEFSSTSSAIAEELRKIYKAITDPLNIV